MRLSFFIIIALIISCQAPEKEETHFPISKTDPCPRKKPVVFDKATPISDSTFISFTAPMDSVENLIETKRLIPTEIPHFENGYKSIWYHKGSIVKIETHIVFYGRPIYHRYYVQDNCHWFYEREEYHESNFDSLVHSNLYYYKDSVILNSFSGAVLYECKLMINTNGNRYSIDRANQARERFFSELEQFSK